MLETLQIAFQAMSLETIIWLIAGVLIGLIFGVTPGLGAVAGLTVVLPLTYAMDTLAAFAFLCGVYMAAVCAGSITAILMRIPGDAGSLATIIDGYELTKQGRSSYALGAAIGSSSVGGVLGAVVFVVFLPIFGTIALNLNAAAYFWIVLIGLIVIAQVIQGQKTKGYAAACLGVMAGTVGVDLTAGYARYTLDVTYLLAGIPLLPLLLGLFGVVHMLNLTQDPPTMVRPSKSKEGGSAMRGVLDVFRHWKTTLRAAFIGGVINGPIPGLGGPTANLMAYSSAKQAAGPSGKFGQGDVRGVIAPETANNATVATSMVPTLTLGVPGTVSAAVFLGALVLHGLQPGRSLVEENSSVLSGIVVYMFLAACLILPATLLSVGVLSKISTIPYHILVPLVFVTLIYGTYSNRGLLQDVWTLIIIGTVGYILAKHDYPPVPLIIGFILGPILELNLRHALMAGDGTALSLLANPVHWILALAALTVLGWPTIKKRVSLKPKTKSLTRV